MRGDTHEIWDLPRLEARNPAGSTDFLGDSKLGAKIWILRTFNALLTEKGYGERMALRGRRKYSYHLLRLHDNVVTSPLAVNSPGNPKTPDCPGKVRAVPA